MDWYRATNDYPRTLRQDHILNTVVAYGYLAIGNLAQDERLVAEAAHCRLLDETAPATRQPRRPDVVRHRLGSLLIRAGSKLQGADLIDPSLTAASVATAVSGL